jgi:hypothetical protein
VSELPPPHATNPATDIESASRAVAPRAKDCMGTGSQKHALGRARIDAILQEQHSLAHRIVGDRSIQLGR